MAHRGHRNSKGRGIDARDHVIFTQAIGDPLGRLRQKLIPGFAAISFLNGAKFIQLDRQTH